MYVEYPLLLSTLSNLKLIRFSRDVSPHNVTTDASCEKRRVHDLEAPPFSLSYWGSPQRFAAATMPVTSIKIEANLTNAVMELHQGYGS
jgi:hypothetical protein